MSLEGLVGFYLDRDIQSPGTVVRVVEQVLAATGMSQVYRSDGPDNSWNEANDFDPREVPGAVISGSAVVYPVGGPASVEIGWDVPVDQFILACNPDHYVWGFIQTPRAAEVAAAVAASIDERIRGDFRADSPMINMGWHDLFERHQELKFIARASFSIGFWGYGSPLNWEGFKKLFFEIPLINIIRADLEAELGPLKEFGYWHD
ncbi:MAG: hypothetical protein JNK70_00495 [Phycisphaerae bacterium]|nr:hypothetical protein [Phycisphaerae bacterium]